MEMIESKRPYQSPRITCEVISLEHSIAASSDCKGAHHGNGNGNGNNGDNGKGCKGPGQGHQVIPSDDFEPIM